MKADMDEGVLAAVARELPEVSTEFFKDQMWLERNGGFVPNGDLALEYFTGSPWYDRGCLNEQWKAQWIQATDELRARSDGIEYRLAHIQPPLLYVIRQEQRKVSRQPQVDGCVLPPTIVLASYYILDGTIYQAPTLDVVISTRMAKCVHHIITGMHLLSRLTACQMEDDFNSMWDFQRRIKDEELASQNTTTATSATVAAGGVSDRREVAARLRELQALFPLPPQPDGGAIQTPPAASRPFPGILGSELEMLLPRAEVRSRTEPNGSDAVKDRGVLPAGVKRKRAL
jgi:hypothetical protein